MMLWKIEAQHSSGDGALMLFRVREDDATHEEVRLRRCGWYVDRELVDTTRQPAIAALLCEGCWPVMPMVDVLMLAQLSRLVPSDHSVPLDTIFELVTQEQTHETM